MFIKLHILSLFLLGGLGTVVMAAGQTDWISGADISMLPTIEKTGAVFRDRGQVGDAIKILRAHGCNLFRVRLFVNPDTNYQSSGGAVQDLGYVRALAQRIKASGAKFLLDLHYSDTWADPGKQYTPREWKDLDFEAMQKQVAEYTTSVLTDLRNAHAEPDMVQVGNEITSGMLWPTGQVWPVKEGQSEIQWDHFAALFNAGAGAVKKFDGDIRVILHIDGGGKPGRTKWFLSRVEKHPFHYDVLALSFYPAWDDSIDALKQNLADAISMTGKDVLIAETSYPWHALPDIKGGTETMRWPTTAAGQKQFLHDLISLLQSQPGKHGIGFVYWYPEAIPVHGMHMWRQG
ncbi:MAG TPA: glycosyl hydrolase 53 family protein, partial [Tepidisphaeraceae bacterium]|nr:glycosyl hydrolase 53 family protein [Tepidisphaeraceae bacterium]